MSNLSGMSTAGWSSGLRSRIQNKRSLVQIPVVSRGGFVMNNYSWSRYILLSILVIYVRFMYIYPLPSYP
jgi:hypothetical protein